MYRSALSKKAGQAQKQQFLEQRIKQFLNSEGRVSRIQDTEPIRLFE
jgi:hypothetical protein